MSWLLMIKALSTFNPNSDPDPDPNDQGCVQFVLRVVLHQSTLSSHGKTWLINSIDDRDK